MDKIKELLENKDFEVRLSESIDTGKVKSLAKEFGTDLTDEEARKAISLLKVKLSDDDLEEVAGGDLIVSDSSFVNTPASRAGGIISQNDENPIKECKFNQVVASEVGTVIFNKNG